MSKSVQPITQPAFYVLLALSQRERHGYEIMKSVEQDSGGQTRLGPGTLYGVIKRLLSEGLIEESGERPVAERDDERRRYYRLTAAGKRRLGLELERFDQAVKKARELGISFNERASIWAA